MSTSPSTSWWKVVIKAVVANIDYDVSKNLDPETAEEGPEMAKELMASCVRAGRRADKAYHQEALATAVLKDGRYPT